MIFTLGWIRRIGGENLHGGYTFDGWRADTFDSISISVASKGSFEFLDMLREDGGASLTKGVEIRELPA